MNYNTISAQRIAGALGAEIARRPRDVDDLEFLDRRVPSAGARTVR